MTAARSQTPTDRASALEMDANDPLSPYREKFFVPPAKDGSDAIYLTGNSLGLMPKSVPRYVTQELDDWQRLGVDGHVQAANPWLIYHELLSGSMARIVGALSLIHI